jgi:hypothetical protein
MPRMYDRHIQNDHGTGFPIIVRSQSTVLSIRRRKGDVNDPIVTAKMRWTFCPDLSPDRESVRTHHMWTCRR